MKIIAIGAVTAGGKTTLVNAIKDKLTRTASLHFDDYSFDGEVNDFYKWVSDGANYNVWDLSPLKADIEKIINSDRYDYLLLDYPFAYQNKMIKDAKTKVPVLPEEAVQEPFITSRMLQKRRLTKHGGKVILTDFHPDHLHRSHHRDCRNHYFRC